MVWRLSFNGLNRTRLVTGASSYYYLSIVLCLAFCKKNNSPGLY